MSLDVALPTQAGAYGALGTEYTLPPMGPWRMSLRAGGSFPRIWHRERTLDLRLWFLACRHVRI